MGLIHRLASRPLALDSIFAVVMTISVVAGSVPASREQPDMRGFDILGWTLLVAAGLSLAVRRLWPGICVAMTFLLTMVYVHFEFAYGPIFLYTMIAIYSAAAWRGTVYAVIATALPMAAHLPWSWWIEREPDKLPFSLFTAAVWLVLPLALGIAIRARRDVDRRSHADEQSRRLYEERLRIAQEVHDAVGHSLAVISMNAGAALHVLTKTADAPQQLAESLRAIRSASGGALDELRTVLAAHPAKGLDLLPDLVEATNSDGLAVTLTTSGDAGPVPSNVDISAYRIVQESLANVVRHARASRATVAIDYQADRLELRITDDGAGGAPKPGGSGIDSMRERAVHLTGTFSACPVPEGGFEVHATLPYRETR